MELQGTPPRPADKEKHRNAETSKYDYVKVRVRLGGHYYVLSRFLLSRILCASGVGSTQAQQISLELKKSLVDRGNLELTQSSLEAQLFELMERRGAAAECRERFRRVTEMRHQRMPLIVLVTGGRCVGKSTLALQLAERLNLTSVVQTDLLYELLLDSGGGAGGGARGAGAGAASFPAWLGEAGAADPLPRYRAECSAMMDAVSADVAKAAEDGKPLVMEGFHADACVFRDRLAALLAQSVQRDGSEHSPVVIHFVLTLPESEADQIFQRVLAVRYGLAPGTERYDRAREQLKAVERANVDSGASRGSTTVVVDLHSHSTTDAMHETVLARLKEEGFR